MIIKVLFVCLGNICRSPLAEGIFKQLAADAGLKEQFLIDSCGTSQYHIGALPHELSREVATLHGFELTHKARQLSPKDYQTFDYVLAMDSHNLHNMRLVSGFHKNQSKIFLMRHFDNEQSEKAVSDPYGGDINDFEECYQVLLESCTNLFSHIRQEKGV